jgi:hypothetical protein
VTGEASVPDHDSNDVPRAVIGGTSDLMSVDAIVIATEYTAGMAGMDRFRRRSGRPQRT